MADETNEETPEETGPVEIDVVQTGEHVLVIVTLRFALGSAAKFAKALSGAVTCLYKNKKKEQRIVTPSGDPRLRH